MANTLKFGNGQWATKVGSTLAYNDEGGNFKPLPFNFTRSTGGTRVNKNGLIEMVTNNKPRIDFLNDSNGALLLEPSRTNLVTYSEQFDNAAWGKLASGTASVPVVTSNQGESPEGVNNASKVVFDRGAGTTSTDFSRLYFSSGSAPASASIYIKSFDGTHYDMYLVCGNAFNAISVTNEWQRFDVTELTTGSNIQLRLQGNLGSESTAEVLVFGAQLEAGSYPTSYIPTQGAIGTRVAETCSQTPPSWIIGQTEGTIYADVNFVGVTEAITNQIFFVREQGSNNGYLFAGFYQGKLNCGMRVSGSLLFDTFFSGVLTKGRYKIAVAYKSGDTKIYINGIQTGFQNNSFGVNNFAQIFLTGSAGTNQLGDINRNFKLYNTRLTDQELINLTTI